METKTPTLKGDPIGVGRIAEVFAWGDDQVLKLFRAEFPQEWADYEAEMGRAVHAAGVTSPAVGEVIEIDGRKGIVFERVDGPTMLRVVGGQAVDDAACGAPTGGTARADARLYVGDAAVAAGEDGRRDWAYRAAFG